MRNKVLRISFNGSTNTVNHAIADFHNPLGLVFSPLLQHYVIDQGLPLIDLVSVYNAFPTVGMVILSISQSLEDWDYSTVISENNFIGGSLTFNYYDRESLLNCVNAQEIGVSSTQTDLSSVLTAINSAKDEILNHVPTIDLTPIENSLTTIKGYTDTLETDLTIIKTGLEGVLKDSLNGDFYSFRDGEEVIVFPDSRPFTVVRSYIGYSGDSENTILYDLIDVNGNKLTASHTFLAPKLSITV